MKPLEWAAVFSLLGAAASFLHLGRTAIALYAICGTYLFDHYRLRFKR